MVSAGPPRGWRRPRRGRNETMHSTRSVVDYIRCVVSRNRRILLTDQRLGRALAIVYICVYVVVFSGRHAVLP